MDHIRCLAEPSSFTGNFAGSVIMGENDKVSFPRNTSISSLESTVSAGSNCKLCESSVKNQTQCMSQTLASSLTAENENVRQGTCQEMQTDHQDTITSIELQRSLEDGYKWRKYGQKNIKGSEYPRSYYRCSHPNCQVKKQLERSSDQSFIQVFYKGKHDHPKPQQIPVGTILSILEEDQIDKESNVHGHTSQDTQPDVQAVCGDVQLNRKDDEFVDDHDELDTKHRRENIGRKDDTPLGKAKREPLLIIQTLSEVDIIDDGYHWHKYGQKVVKGNPNPRSYYKCANIGCTVRKHVERASHNLKAVITTYEGKHNHDVPTAWTSSQDKTRSTVNNLATTRSEEHDTINLDLGIGICSGSKPKLNKQRQ